MGNTKYRDLSKMIIPVFVIFVGLYNMCKNQLLVSNLLIFYYWFYFSIDSFNKSITIYPNNLWIENHNSIHFHVFIYDSYSKE